MRVTQRFGPATPPAGSFRVSSLAGPVSIEETSLELLAVIKTANTALQSEMPVAIHLTCDHTMAGAAI